LTPVLPATRDWALCSGTGSAEGRVSACLVTWNSAGDVAGCVDSLSRQANRPDEIIVVDNGSRDGSARRVLELAPQATLIVLPENVGFCRAMNLAIERSTGDYVLTLNPDCRLAPTFLSHAMEVLVCDPGVGSVAAKLLRFDDQVPPREPRTIDSAGLALRLGRRVINEGEGRLDGAVPDRSREAFGACAAAGLYRRAALETIRDPESGIFDETFFAYKEDADVAWRLRSAGWRCVYQPQAVAFHRRAWRRGGRRSVPEPIRVRSLQNRWLLLAKNESVGSFLVNLPQLMMFELAILAHAVVRERCLLRAYPEGARQVLSALRRRRRHAPGRRQAGATADARRRRLPMTLRRRVRRIPGARGGTSGRGGHLNLKGDS
jgi:GT2 family glycosyltransferase